MYKNFFGGLLSVMGAIGGGIDGDIGGGKLGEWIAEQYLNKL